MNEKGKKVMSKGRSLENDLKLNKGIALKHAVAVILQRNFSHNLGINIKQKKV